MLTSLALAGALLTGLVASPDTTVDLRRGDRIVVVGLSGALAVEVWDRPQLALVGQGGDARDLTVERGGDRVTVRSGDRKHRQLEVEARLRVPEWVDLEISGRSLELRIEGISGDVSARNVSGDIRVSDTRGDLELSSVEGSIHVDRVRGSVAARSRGEDVQLQDVTGSVQAHSGDGDVVLRNVNGSAVAAETLDGDIYFEGALEPRGKYAFSVHDGDATLVLPRNTGASVNVSTFDGEFQSEFPVTLKSYGGGGVFEFALGDGSAILEVRVFDGEINFVKAP